MPKNRIIHNVQDLFFGLPGGETSELPGYHIARRINRVQSFGYNFDVNRTDVGVIGKTQNASRPIIEPVTISLDFNYFLEGVTNERRIGFSVDNQTTSDRPLFISGFFNTGRLFDARNIYLVTNQASELDIRGQNTTYEMAYSGLLEGSPSFLIDPNATGYGVLVFQNAYVSNYSVNISVGTLSEVNVSCVADNLIYFSSGNDVRVPLLNLKGGNSYTESTALLIPKHFKENGSNVGVESSLFKPGNIVIDIQKSTQTGINFHTEVLQSFSLDIPLERENVSYLGYKLYADRPLRLPIKASIRLGFLDNAKLSGSLLNEMGRDDLYNFVVNCKRNDGVVGLKYIVSGAKLESVSHSSSIGDNNTSEINLSVEMDLDNYRKGIFVSGQVKTITGRLIDDFGNEITGDEDSIYYEYYPFF
jgi:hypothetical protein